MSRPTGLFWPQSRLKGACSPLPVLADPCRDVGSSVGHWEQRRAWASLGTGPYSHVTSNCGHLVYGKGTDLCPFMTRLWATGPG